MDTANNDAAVQTKKVLFVTNSESGQANTVLAMALEATKRPHLEVHIASFPVLKRRIERLSPNVNFHPLDGKDLFETMAEQGISEETLPHPPTTKSLEPYGRALEVVLVGWDMECAFCFLPL
jgi:UDP:flavonoid glycosyltransferase YjiC (YdhE family)